MGERMITYRGEVSIGLVGCKRTIEFELPEGHTEQEFDEALQDAAFEYVDYWAEPVSGDTP